MPLATIKFTRTRCKECLLLTDRNHPNLWASKARLAAVHGQLDEARWTPFSYWSASTQFGFLPRSEGRRTTTRRRTPCSTKGFGEGWQPAWSIGVRGTIPLWTFGKIDAIKRAAEANVRYTEWISRSTRSRHANGREARLLRAHARP